MSSKMLYLVIGFYSPSVSAFLICVGVPGTSLVVKFQEMACQFLQQPTTSCLSNFLLGTCSSKTRWKVLSRDLLKQL